jgi:8-oxo-dGTP pyrophosphatase MutT (NUDIX family)
VDGRVVYANPWISVREDVVRRADGSTGIYGVVDKAHFALVVPRGVGGVWLVQQFRYPVGRRAWEFPQGTWGHGASGSPEDLARAELAEETGLRAGSLTRLGHLDLAAGLSSQEFDVWLAEDLVEGPPQREVTELDMVHRFVSDAELDAMVGAGELVDAASLAALHLLSRHG